eukprot:Gb_20798 [translate_table: standard]
MVVLKFKLAPRSFSKATTTTGSVALSRPPNNNDFLQFHPYGNKKHILSSTLQPTSTKSRISISLIAADEDCHAQFGPFDVILIAPVQEEEPQTPHQENVADCFHYKFRLCTKFTVNFRCPQASSSVLMFFYENCKRSLTEGKFEKSPECCILRASSEISFSSMPVQYLIDREFQQLTDTVQNSLQNYLLTSSLSAREDTIHGRNSSIKFTGMLRMNCHTSEAFSLKEKCYVSKGKLCFSSLDICCQRDVLMASMQQTSSRCNHNGKLSLCSTTAYQSRNDDLVLCIAVMFVDNSKKMVMVEQCSNLCVAPLIANATWTRKEHKRDGAPMPSFIIALLK